MEIDDLHTEDHHNEGRDHVSQDPGNLFLKEVAKKSYQNSHGNGKKDGEENRDVMKFGYVKDDLNVSKGDGKIERGKDRSEQSTPMLKASLGMYGGVHGCLHKKDTLL